MIDQGNSADYYGRMAKREIVIPVQELVRLEVVCLECGGSSTYDASKNKMRQITTACGLCGCDWPSGAGAVIESHKRLFHQAGDGQYFLRVTLDDD